ncbi:hypothetical protein P2318_16590 [Myxococcaceae bacterium GXIMD 01537]
MTPLLRPELYSVLLRGLDEAVAADPSLDAARRQLLLPLQLLDAIADQTPGTLGDDPLAMERLRILLTSASAHAVPPSTASTLTTSVTPPGSPALVPPAPTTASRGSKKGRNSQAALASAVNSRLSSSISCPPGLLHLGWLVAIGLAAGRTGQLMSLTTPFIQTVLGLALATGPAETLATAVAAGLPAEHIRVLLAALASPGTQDSQSSGLSHAIASFLTDPIQRFRWVCMVLLFEHVMADVAKMSWEGASATGIMTVRPRAACPGEEVTLWGFFPESLVANFDNVGEPDGQSVVFAAPGEALRVATFVGAQLSSASGPNEQPYYESITVKVPDDVRPGWVGFTDPRARTNAAEARTSLRRRWEARNESEAILSEMPVPVDLIQPLPEEPAPPLLGVNVFKGGRPLILDASLSPKVVSAGETVRLEWATEGATNLRVAFHGLRPRATSTRWDRKQTLPPRGSLELVAGTDLSDVSVTLVAMSGCGDESTTLSGRVRTRIVGMSARQPGRSDSVLVEGESFELTLQLSPQPNEVEGWLKLPGEAYIAGRWTDQGFSFWVPAEHAHPGLSGTITVGPSDDEVDDEKPLDALTFTSPVRVVLLRLAVLECDEDGCRLQRISRRAAWNALSSAQESLGIAVRKVEAHWVDDMQLVTAPVDGSDAPGVERLLERLAGLAATHPGFEDATWVALLPGESAVARHATAEAAWSVAVATASQLSKVLIRKDVPRIPAARVLRLVGTLGTRDSLTLERAREEVRARGPGAAVDSGLVAVGLDVNGRELATQAVRTTRSLGTRGFVTLLPISNDTVQVQLRAGNRPVYRIQRPTGAPNLSQVALSGNELTWLPGHTHSARGHITVEMQWEGGWCPVATAGSCETSLTLPPHRLTPYGASEDEAVALRLVITDGWNTAVANVPEPLNTRTPHLALRAAGEGRYWADVAEQDGVPEEARWTLGDREASGLAFRVLPEESGTLTLSVSDTEESLSLEEPDDHHCD